MADNTREQKVKRNRGNNFTKEEELLLLSEIEKYKQIIECKMTDKVNLSEKNEAWRKIQIGFNSKHGSHRNSGQLKIKYDNLKCKTRKIVASNKNYVRGTGGGPAGDTALDPVIEAVLRIINKTSVVGLHNEHDCDNATELEIDEILPTNSVQTLNKNSVPNKENSLCNTWELVFDTNGQMVFHNEGGEGSQEMDLLAPSGSEQMEMQNVEVVEIADSKKKNEQSEEAGKTKQANWSKYTPKKLRTPMSRRLREVINNPIKESYYRKKIELMDEEIRKRKLEQEDILVNQKRSEEEHEKKMYLLDLDIKLKEKMLNE